MGRMTQESQTIGGVTYVIGTAYDPVARTISTPYPSQRVIQEKYDAVGRLSEVDNGTSPVYTVNAYNAAGQILTGVYGNQMQSTYAYNSQMQLAAIRYGTSSGALLDLAYGFGSAGNNGQIQSITDNLTPARSTNYVYDELGRLQMAQTSDQTSPNTWKLKFSYDRYGNRISETPIGGTGLMPMNEVIADSATNHLRGAGQTYDLAGNMTYDGADSYTFDAAGRITQVDGSNTYVYNATGFRVKKNSTVYIASGGQVLAEYAAGAAPAAPSVEYVYVGGQLAVTVASGATTYLYADHLSVRSSADSTGAPAGSHGNFPSGETWYQTGAANKWQYTTYERDALGQDYARARFYLSTNARFLS